jgi:hypothetical protein
MRPFFRWRRNTQIGQEIITVEGRKCSASLTDQGWHKDSANSQCSRATEKFCHFLLEIIILTAGDRTQTFPLENDPETSDKFSLEKDHRFHQVSLEDNKEDSQKQLHYSKRITPIHEGRCFTVRITAELNADRTSGRLR